ncbi:type II toxin-antitoxin system VapC family toxin [Rubneribacter sp.]|nr:type II toxin-antitoxin system VapC family toxin [Candidatus Rubneribacter avistercoris]
MIVLDCNAALEMAMGTQDGAGLKMLLLKGEKTYAPELFCYEVTHVLSKYVRGGYLSQEQAIRCGMRAFASVDEFVDDKGSWVEVSGESNRLQHSTYDLFYFVLARRLGATLFTLDKKLQALCANNGVNCVYLDAEFGQDA